MSIAGISFDTPEENRAFVEANGFPFPLLSDEDRAIGRSYGVARDPGHPYVAYPRRVTYVVDPEGIVRLSYVVASSQIAGHPDRVLDDLRALIG